MEPRWGNAKTGVPQGSVIGALLFPVYINDFEEGIEWHVKFFADDTSFFSIVNDPVVFAESLQHDPNWKSTWLLSGHIIRNEF